MQAKVTTEFAGRPDDEALSRTIKVGEIINGDLAAVAVREKWAEEAGDDPADDDGEGSTQPPLDTMTIAQLKAFADEKGIDIGDASKKDDIRAAIDLALESQK